MRGRRKSPKTRQRIRRAQRQAKVRLRSLVRIPTSLAETVERRVGHRATRFLFLFVIPVPIPIAGLLYLYVQVPWTWQCFVAVGYCVGLEVRVAELPQEERHFVGELQVVLGAG